MRAPVVGLAVRADELEERARGTSEAAVGLWNEDRGNETDDRDDEGDDGGGAEDPGIERFELSEVETRPGDGEDQAGGK